jgi:hypothetical protein
MGIEKLQMYTCVCDCCGVSADEDTDYSCWNDESVARDVAMNADWLVEKGMDYCPKCYYYDDEDNLVLKYKP